MGWWDSSAREDGRLKQMVKFAVMRNTRSCWRSCHSSIRICDARKTLRVVVAFADSACGIPFPICVDRG